MLTVLSATEAIAASGKIINEREGIWKEKVLS
jgi:hypothetical protein